MSLEPNAVGQRHPAKSEEPKEMQAEYLGGSDAWNRSYC